MLRKTALLLLIALPALGQTLFDGGAPALPGVKIDAHAPTAPTNQTFFATEFNSQNTNIQLIENVLLGDAGYPSYPTLAGGWVTAFDCDFTAQPLQLLSTNGPYTICGVVWTKINSANDATAMAVDGGLIITPVAATNYLNATRTLPAITLPLLDAGMPSLDGDTDLRLTVWMQSGNFAANNDQIVAAFDDNAHNGLSAYEETYIYSTSLQWGVRVDYSGTTVSTLTPNGGNVGVLSIRGGAQGGRLALASGTYSSGWPSLSSAAGVSPLLSVAGFPTGDVSNLDNPNAWVLLLGAARNGSGTSFVANIGRVRLEYKK